MTGTVVVEVGLWLGLDLTWEEDDGIGEFTVAGPVLDGSVGSTRPANGSGGFMPAALELRRLPFSLQKLMRYDTAMGRVTWYSLRLGLVVK